MESRKATKKINEYAHVPGVRASGLHVEALCTPRGHRQELSTCQLPTLADVVRHGVWGAGMARLHRGCGTPGTRAG